MAKTIKEDMSNLVPEITKKKKDANTVEFTETKTLEKTRAELEASKASYEQDKANAIANFDAKIAEINEALALLS